MGKILAVDDSATLRESLSFVLTDAGHDITQAENGLDGIQKFINNQSYDLIITDINMPQMDGLEFLQNVRKISREIPVLILTTESEQEKMQTAKSLKANAWIIKPFKQEDLLTIVNKLLE
jgi:two-component system, chemotaxis family, chemotaxis protein CheY